MLAALSLLPLLGGCGMVVLDPAGDVARQQGDLVVISTLLMLIIIVPVMALTGWFAWKYRAANTAATYKPDWDHSTQLELLIWAVPLLIIICLGAVTWVGTHLLDPYRPLARTAPGQPVGADVKPLEVQVVALHWKWLFIYPEQGIATVNELAVPEGRPLKFRISSSSVMNSFYVPAMAGQIYAMPGMETKLHAVFNETGNYEGFSANYSGAGFSNMRFGVRSMTEAGFERWASQAKARGTTLDRAAYLKLERPSEKEPVRRYAQVDSELFDRIVNMCVEPGKMCMHDMMAIDQRGGMGRAGLYNVRQLSYDKFAARGTGDTASDRYIAENCSNPELLGTSLARVEDQPVNLAELTGAGLSRPGTRALSPARNSDKPASARPALTPVSITEPAS
ncbi:MAG: ubiquinol oxidase subunit II [Blastomonas fulva]|nr:ubiquinol oxidase subunit II [Blastomonas fulva]MDM7928056.1 ubiquinol oxidase subunit II [Blastomonas fulva]MDM7967818.1 ubiquinol oxidase subunit II [Blastomonas fulva]